MRRPAQVLWPRSIFEQYFELALVPYVHYVPVWTTGPEDLLQRIAWLAQNPDIGQRIAAEGRRLACAHLTRPGRVCWWRATVEQYRRHVARYVIDDSTIARRRAPNPPLPPQRGAVALPCVPSWR